MRKRPAGQDSSLLWSMDNDQGNQWYQDAIDIQFISDDFEVR
jgi:hypothetical protein